MTNAMGRLMVYMIGVLAQFEREQISERTITGMMEKAQQGYYPHGNKAPYGYRKDKNHKLSIVPGEVKIIKEAFDLYVKQELSEYSVSDLVYKKYGKKLSAKNLRNFLNKNIHFGIVIVGGVEYKVVKPIFNLADKKALEKRRKLNEFSKKDYKYRNKVYINGTRALHSTTIKRTKKGETREYPYYLKKGVGYINEEEITKVISKKYATLINQNTSDSHSKIHLITKALVDGDITKKKFDVEYERLIKLISKQNEITRINITINNKVIEEIQVEIT